MRADAAARSGETDHQIIDPPAGQKAELIEELRNLRHELVNGLHQQCPVPCRQVAVAVLGERTTAQLPGRSAMLEYDPRLDFLLQGQAGQLVCGQRALETGKGLADEQRLLLPVIAKKLFSGHAAGQGGCGRGHDGASRSAGAGGVAMGLAGLLPGPGPGSAAAQIRRAWAARSEEHTSELQS